MPDQARSHTPTKATKRSFRIAVIEGDGIGHEVVPVGLAIMVHALRDSDCSLEFTSFPWGCDYYRQMGQMMSTDALDHMREFDAIYLGAVGAPDVPDHVSLRDLLLPIRQRFDQYVNLRPMRLLRGIKGPLAGRTSEDIDMICVRENSEGEYAGTGGRLYAGTANEVALQTSVFTRRGVERVARFAFDLAHSRPRGLLASATKSNAMQHSMVMWDETIRIVAREYSDVACRRYHVDALAARMITHPETLDVIVASNLFGDILTDLGAALIGGLGVAASANINPDGSYPSMFEPVHGSAPDIAGKGIANPIAAIWSAAMLLDHLGMRNAHDRILMAVDRVLSEDGPRTPDLGGNATTRDVAMAVAAALS